MTGQIRALDGLRAIAALMVLTTHVAFHSALVTRPVIGQVTSRLDFGVCLFFFLSGFLLYRPWALASFMRVPGPSHRAYFRKRFARVYPAFLVLVVVVLGFYAPSRTTDIGVWLKYLTLTQVYTPGNDRQGLTHIWSLSMEVAFYLVLPLLALAAVHLIRFSSMAQRHLALLVALTAAGFAFNVLRGWTDLFPESLAGFWLPAHLSWFAGGMLLAVVQSAITADAPRPSWFDSFASLSHDWTTWLIIAAGALILALTPLAGPLTPYDPITSFASGPWYIVFKEGLYGACAFALLVPLVLGRQDSPYARALSAPAMVWLGRISYGVFLWHLVLLGGMSSLMGIGVFQGWFWLLWPATIAASVAVAWLSWILLESRCIRWSVRSRPDRGGGRRQPRSRG